MYDPERLELIWQDMAVLRERLAKLAASIVLTEERLASTLEQVARNRPSHDAERLLAKASAARQFAEEERGRAAVLDVPFRSRWAPRADPGQPVQAGGRASDATPVTSAGSERRAGRAGQRP